MALSKAAAFITFVGVTGLLLGANMRAQNPSNAAGSSADALPKDVYPDSRNRLPLPKRDEMDDEGKKAFDEWSSGLQMASINRPPLRLYSPRLAQPLDKAGAA